MARTPSNMLPLGTKAPLFSLPDVVTSEIITLESVYGIKGTLLMFICNHCPFVKHIESELISIANDFQPKGIKVIGISSNDVEKYPADHPDKMRELAIERNYPFNYLYDESQEVAKSFDAACTPDFYLFDKDLFLVYRGQLDDSRPDNGIPVSGKDLRNALTSVLNGVAPDNEQYPSIGCNIKWK
ncbi:MAG TPA: thioredoxin family protein [Oligoflexia bacterium]|nr:thioredoxin family protein [Oligoflexia bacterium]HMP49003.1 thioredoxin family protein [Oligoflexia bacterium]